MTLLIFAEADDVHANAVQWAYGKLGEKADVFDYSRYLTSTPISSSISTSAPLFVTLDEAHPPLADYRVVWNRRAPALKVPDELDGDDRELAKSVGRRHLDQLRALDVPHGQTWVNDRFVQLRYENKLNQLKLARDLGFLIPDTLISNDPGRVRAFAKRHREVVVKTIAPMVWKDETHARWTMTEVVMESDLQDDVAIASCPMIYQNVIRKKHEVRVVGFGQDILIARLMSQDSAKTQLDWRNVNPAEMRIMSDSDDDLERRLRNFMQSSGLLHGSFDLAVDHEGQYVFFEVNEQGQSLWLEQVNPELRIFERLIQFLRSPAPDFMMRDSLGLHFADYWAVREAQVG